MTRISIFNLRSQDTASFLKDEKNNLVNTVVNRASKTSLISGGSGTVSLTRARTEPPHYDPPYYDIGESNSLETLR